MRGGVLTHAGRCVALLAFGALSACVLHDAYPRDWADVHLSSAMRCGDYAGTYREVGEASAARRVRLSEFLGVPTRDNLAGVRLDVDAAGRVVVRRLRLTSDGDVRAEDEPGAVLACKDGVLQFPPRATSRDGLLIGVATQQTTWAKADDGALVVRAASDAAGTTLVVMPVAGSDLTWYRFRPLAR